MLTHCVLVDEVFKALNDPDGLTSVTVESYFDPATKTFENFGGGIPFIVSGMKILLETGKPLVGGQPG